MTEAEANAMLEDNPWAKRSDARDLLLTAAAIGAKDERERMRRLIADDAWALTFESLGQYRAALLGVVGG